MPNGQVIQHPMWPPGVGPNRPVHPGPEPIHRPPWQGGTWPHPDWCDCGCDPCTCGGGMPHWSQDAIRCWNEMQQFRQMVQEIVQGELARLPAGITGVTDGSDAKPGEVGEFVSFKTTVNFAVGTNTQSVSVGVLPPGDWDVWGFSGNWSVPVNAAIIFLHPLPAGFSNTMTGYMLGEYMSLENARALLSTPTLLPFSVNIQGTSSAGTGVITIEARRRR